jgi:type III secretion protein L
MAPSVRKQRPVRDNPIIRQEVVGATTEAKKIIAEAEEEADRIIEEANEAARQTHEKGFEEGREQALAQFTQQTSEALLRIESMAQAIEPTYVGLIRHCVEKIIDGELRMHPDAIVGVVRNALRDARQQREIIVRVHPADVDALGKSKAKLLEMLARAQTVEIRGDESIRRGGCVVVTELGTIDASLDRQLEALEVALDTELREGGSGDYPEEAEESELDPEDDPGYGGRY